MNFFQVAHLIVALIRWFLPSEHAMLHASHMTLKNIKGRDALVTPLKMLILEPFTAERNNDENHWSVVGKWI